MKTLLTATFLGGALLLAGCTGTTTTATSTTTDPLANLTTALQSVQTFTVTDLQTAQKEATANGLTEDAACWGYLAAQVQGTSSTNVIVPTGVASTFEAGRVVVHNGANALSAAQKTAFETNCGPMIVNIEGDVAALSIAVGAKVALPPLALVPVTP
jgi:urocanate hydratase